ncbi:MAG: DUF6580 family putative transport protein [Bacteroidota bacterium]
MNNEILDYNEENTNKFTPKFGLIVVMILAAAATRFLPHPPNFTALGGMALFGAAYFSKKYWAFLVPFATLWLSDLILNNVVYAAYHDGFTLLPTYAVWTYVAFGLMILMGSKVLKKVKLPRVIGASIGASLIFFLVTNFGVWFFDSMNVFTDDASGLLAAYAAGLPFFWNTLVGDLFFVGILFGGFELIKSVNPQLALTMEV